MSAPNFINTDSVILGMKLVKWQVNVIPLIYVHFMHFVQKTLKFET